ncbi:MAG: phenylalanine--tRNA ligase subunit beta [Phycisphaerales bacterium]|nr:phenylalanine--tRNA ligase subunit beta [Phycisphaerales bacterium]
MPVINMPVDLLLRLVSADRSVMDEARLPQTLHDMGIEVDELTRTKAYGCPACENVIERTEAQGAPAACGRCGADFREAGRAARELGERHVARLDMLAVRPDIFDAGGMARYMRGFLGVQTGLIRYPVEPAQLTARVDPRLSRDDSYRPCIACGVIRDLSLSDETIRLLMNMQEDLHWALGRDRKLASIGVYDLDTLRTDGPLHYRAVAPDELTFAPLGSRAADPASALTPRDILLQHRTGREYAHLLSGFAAYPLLTDSAGTVLSMPPIINSESTRVTAATRNCFVDVTGLAQRTVDRALNILLSGLREVCPTVRLEAVKVEYPDRTITTPDFSAARMSLSARDAAATIGASLDAAALAVLLERMGHGVQAEGDTLHVSVPAWRNDVMHPIDLVEDAAVAFGYDRLSAALVPTFTVGGPRRIEEQSAIARRALAGLGYHQVMTLVLTSEPAAFERWRLGPGAALGDALRSRLVRIENPISSEQTVARLSLLPGLLETLALNRQHDLPQQIFEVGDVCYLDPAVETGAREERCTAAALIGTHVGYADARAACDAFMREFDLAPERDYRIAPPTDDDPRFLPGRFARILDRRGQCIGMLGELHPEIIEGYGLSHAVAVMEWSLAQLLAD